MIKLTIEEKKQRKAAYQVKYHARKRLDPAYKEWHRAYAAARRVRLKDDPDYKDRTKKQALQYYYKNIRPIPEKRQAFRSKVRRSQQRRRVKLQEVRKSLQALIGGHCVDCGITDYRLLDFDHINPRTKTMNVSQKLHLPFDILAEEVMGCQLRCPNCHRLKTMEQGGNDSRVREFRNPPKHSAF